MNYFLLTATDGKIIGGDPSTINSNTSSGQTAGDSNAAAGDSNTTTSTGTTSTAQPAQASSFGLNYYTIFALYAVFFVAYYFMSIRPRKKKKAEDQERMNNLTTGDQIMTTSGLYGVIVDKDAKTFTVEFGTNKGVRIPVRRDCVLLIPKASEESEDKKDKKDKKDK